MTPAAAAIGGVLVRLPNWLGDALMARPFLFALRGRLPAARITAVGPPALLELLAPDGAWDAAVAWPAAGASLAALRAARPASAWVLPPSFSSAVFAWRTGARLRAGFAGQWRGAFLTRALARGRRGERHLGREYLDLLEHGAGGAGIPLVAPPALAPSHAAVAGAETLLAAEGLASAPVAVLAPGAIYGPAKRWPAARFGELARALRARGVGVAVCGGEAEGEACAAVVSASGGTAVSLSGRTSLPVQAAICARAFAVVSNDSGMAHLGGATGAPTVAIFGSTSSAWTAPLGPRVRVVQRAPACSPCFRRTCRIGAVCLTAVSVHRVLAALDDVARVAGEGRA